MKIINELLTKATPKYFIVLGVCMVVKLSTVWGVIDFPTQLLAMHLVAIPFYLAAFAWGLKEEAMTVLATREMEAFRRSFQGGI